MRVVASLSVTGFKYGAKQIMLGQQAKVEWATFFFQRFVHVAECLQVFLTYSFLRRPHTEKMRLAIGTKKYLSILAGSRAQQMKEPLRSLRLYGLFS